MIGPARISSVAIGWGHDWQGGIIGKDMIGWRHNQKGHRPSDRHQDRPTHLLTMSPTHEIAAALSNPTTISSLTRGRQDWDRAFYSMATETLKEIMTCPLCNGPIQITEERSQGHIYRVKCDGACQPSQTFSVGPWFSPFFVQHFEDLLEMNRAFFEKYRQSCCPITLEAREKLLASRLSDREESVPIR